MGGLKALRVLEEPGVKLLKSTGKHLAPHASHILTKPAHHEYP